MFCYTQLVRQNGKHLSMTWGNLCLWANLTLYCSRIHCSQVDIFRLQTSVSLWLLLIAIKYLSIFHLKTGPAAKQESHGIIKKKNTLIPHGTLT